ncbi:MAG: MerR family transcriptional regulator [Armatimonadetes bacterium]|nr:MerR family transcriptional regulator [Armatimonadota bacterium]MDW8153822.1 MerR family transcriptional regulator [Armatimonadota bacterium]
MSGPKEELFPIGIVSLLTGLRPSTLRRWEERGLVAPVRSGRRRLRLYSWRDIEQIRLLRHLMETEGLSPLQARAAIQEGWPRFTGWEQGLWRNRPPRRGGNRIAVVPVCAVGGEESGP